MVFVFPLYEFMLCAIASRTFLGAEDYRMQGRPFFREGVVWQQPFVGKEIQGFTLVQANAHPTVARRFALQLQNFGLGVFVLGLLVSEVLLVLLFLR